MKEFFKDHSGKPSQGRLCAILGLLIAGVLAFWVEPMPSFEVLAVFVFGPSGAVLWQKVQAPSEHVTAPEIQNVN